jgi:hypothetical protein
VYQGEGVRLFWMDGQQKSALDVQTIRFLRD